MALQYGAGVRALRLIAIRSQIFSNNGECEFWAGTVPANVAAPNGSSVNRIADMIISPSAWNAPSGGGVMTIVTANWLPAIAANSGTITYFRLINQSSNYFMQGTVGLSGSGADMIVDNVNMVAGQAISVLSFTITDNNA